MRMWMIEPRLLCRQHLLGEHSEIHKHRHNFVKQHSIRGRHGQIEPMAMEKRHDSLAAEMVNRGYKHQSPYKQPCLDHLEDIDRLGKVNRLESMRELANRCCDCSERMLWHALKAIRKVE